MLDGKHGRLSDFPVPRDQVWHPSNNEHFLCPTWPPHAGRPHWVDNLGGHASCVRWLILSIAIGLISTITGMFIFPSGMASSCRAATLGRQFRWPCVLCEVAHSFNSNWTGKHHYWYVHFPVRNGPSWHPIFSNSTISRVWISLEAD
jgi:hypothetical protein